MFVKWIPQLPLLRRELTELANRRRTYIVRFVGAIALLSIVFVVFRISMARAAGGNVFFQGGPWAASTAAGPFRFMGIGGTVFQDIVPWLFRSIQLLMPALCCGTITMEKERNTLGTLFLTRLSPLAIVLEKLGSRLVPMLTFLLLTFPVLAYVYSLGGVDTTLLIGTLWLLLCECLLYASIGMLCSSWFRTTVSAFICSYVLVLLLVVSSSVLRRLTPTPYDIWLGAFLGDNFAMPQMIGAGFPGGVGAGNVASSGPDVFAILVLMLRSFPAVFLSFICLFLARVFLFRRAFVTSSSPILSLFRIVDRFFVRLNEKTTRGIELVKDTNSMPDFDPIAWRERTRKSLGKARYLFRVLTILEVPTVFICGLAAISSAGSGFAGLRVLLIMMWVLTALILTVKASTAISSERARETIEPLLSTPMSAAQILREKIVGMRRLMIVLSIPILTIHFTLLLLHVDVVRVIRSGGLFYAGTVASYLILVIVTTFNSMLLLSWVSAGLGMRFHSQMKSVLAGVTLNGAWILLPIIAAGIVWIAVRQTGYGYYSPMQAGPVAVLATLPIAASPAGPMVMNEIYLNAATGDRYLGRDFFFRLSDNSNVVLLIAAGLLAFQIVALVLLRSLVLRFAPLLLNRRDDSTQAPRVIQAVLQSQPAV